MRRDCYMVGVDLGPPDPVIRERYLPGIPADAKLDPWGVARWPSSSGDSQAVCGPLREMTTPRELDRFPFPAAPEATPGLRDRRRSRGTVRDSRLLSQ